MAEKKQELKQIDKKITDQVLARVNQLQEAKQLDLPPEFSAGNAIRAAELILLEKKDKSGVPVLEACTRPSIASALLKMVISGLSPIKDQCYFIPYGKTLNFQPSYHGRIAMAKRIGLTHIAASVIYEGDDFAFTKDPTTGLTSITKHDQSFGNIDMNKIVGAYCVYSMEDGYTDVEIMTIVQIKKAWMQGATKGESPAHKNFSDQMAKKTVIGRACTAIISRSTDGYLNLDPIGDAGDESEKPEANTIDVGFEELTEEHKPTENKSTPTKEAAQPTEPPADQDKAGMDQAALEFEQEEAERQAKKRSAKP